jgi:glycosyltransferase involved in cell wall biosynthesis
MSSPFFSVVIPALNEERTLPHLLSDLSKQTYEAYEVIVVDGNSDDRTQERVKIWKEKNDRIKLLTSSKRNVSVQRNKGGKAAKGEYIVFFDADNRIPPTFLADLSFQLRKHPCDGATTYFEADTTNVSDKLFATVSNMVTDMTTSLGSPSAYGACIICKRDVFTSIEGFDPHVTYMEDTVFVRQLVARGYVFRVFKTPLFVYSLRRYRKEGTLRLLRKVAPAALTVLVKGKVTEPVDTYPMLGGSYFRGDEKKKKVKPTVAMLNDFLEQISEIVGLEAPKPNKRKSKKI